MWLLFRSDSEPCRQPTSVFLKQRVGELQFGLMATKDAPNLSKTMVSGVKLAGTGEVIFPVNVDTSGGICPP